MSYKLLSERIRKYIYDKGWEELRPIQAAAINAITLNDNNYILISHTASGKTEAAFLPILSKVDFNLTGVQVLYISPLIALINDQFYRIENLCKNLEITVTKWHGEANKSLKNKLIKKPNGIILITPESLESMFVNSSSFIPILFSKLKYIIIDEIHSFLGTDRGLQLMSIISRMNQQLNKTNIIQIGLSATIAKENYMEVKRFTGNIEKTKILVDNTKKEAKAQFKYFKNQSNELPTNLIQDLYQQTAQSKALIFPNNRGRTEEISVKLKKISERLKGHPFYYSHHSSVDKEIREMIERFLKDNKTFYFCVCATSTLELGIDIGTVDKIIQIDSTESVASLVQRMGRSGRDKNKKSIINFYATDKWSLLQSLACWNLYKEDFLEDIEVVKQPFDILLHQMLSIVKQLSGCSKKELIRRIHSNSTFKEIEKEVVEDLINKFIELEYLELIDFELILGLKGEEIVNSYEFYSVFKNESNLQVLYSGKKIGDLPFSPKIQVDENILLAAKIWKIKDIDFQSSKIIVIPAKDGKNPKFFGLSGNIHQKIRKKMFQILKSENEYEELEECSKIAIEEMRFYFKDFKITNFEFDLPTIEKEEKLLIYTFTGTKINKSLNFLLSLEAHCVLYEYQSLLEINIKKSEFEILVSNINEKYKNLDKYLELELKKNRALIEFCKWGKYLPLQYQIEILKERFYNFNEAIKLLNRINLVKAD